MSTFLFFLVSNVGFPFSFCCWQIWTCFLNAWKNSFMVLLFLLFLLLLMVTVFPVLVIGLFELLVFVSLSLFVFVTGVWLAVFVFVTVGLFVFVVVVDTSDVAAVNMKKKKKLVSSSFLLTCNWWGWDSDASLVLGCNQVAEASPDAWTVRLYY